MNENTIFRLKGFEKCTGNVLYTEWRTLDTSLEAVNNFFAWFSTITYNQTIEYKKLFSKGSAKNEKM